MATHSSILAWRIPWTEEPCGLCPWGCKESDMTEQPTLNLNKLSLHSTYEHLCNFFLNNFSFLFFFFLVLDHF